jgi:Tfp pilus assembly protein PilF
MSVLWYAEKALWPTGLAAFYPHPQSLPPANVLGLTVFAGAALTIGVLALARRRPWLCVGWLWFLGMLVPMSGLVQVGMQARADRYAYLPMIGLELAIAYELWAWLASRRAVYAVLTTGVALALAAATHRQVGYWQDGGTLFGRALAVTDDNFLAHEQVGRARLAAGDSEGAARHFSEALRIEPRWAKARSGLGLALQAQGRREEAIWNHREAVRLDPNDGALRLALAAALIEAGWTDDAIRELRIGARRTPVRHASRAAVAHRLGQLLQQRGRDAEAIDAYRGALAAKPDHAAARNDVAWLLAASHNPGLRKPDEALQLAESNAPEGDANRLDTLAVALAANGRFAEALAALDRAEVALAPEDAALAAGIETRRRAFESSRAWIDEAPPR